MVDCHGSQCGFCTPGFVMSLWSHTSDHQRAGTRPTRQQLADELVRQPVPLHRLPADPRRRRAHVRSAGASSEHRGRVPRRRGAAQHREPSTTGAERRGAGGTIASIAPHDARRARRAAREPAARRMLLAGSTDVGLWVNKQFRDLGDIIYVGEVAELKRIEVRDGALHDRRRRLARRGLGGAGAARYPSLTDVWLRFASPPIRHMPARWAATSPTARRSATRAPVLIALDAQLAAAPWRADVRRMPLADFYVDYMRQPAGAGRVRARRIRCRCRRPTASLRGYKICKRFDSDISARVRRAFRVRLDGETRARRALRVSAAWRRSSSARAQAERTRHRPALERGDRATPPRALTSDFSR